jgi:hypothetical protein
LDGLQRSKVGGILRRLDVITPIFFSDTDTNTEPCDLRIVESIARKAGIHERTAPTRKPSVTTWPKSHPDWPGMAPSAHSSCRAERLSLISSMRLGTQGSDAPGNRAFGIVDASGF